MQSSVWEETQSNNEDYHILRRAKECYYNRLATPSPLWALHLTQASSGILALPGSHWATWASHLSAPALLEQEKVARAYIFHPLPPVLMCNGHVDWVEPASPGASLGMLMPGRGAR